MTLIFSLCYSLALAQEAQDSYVFSKGIPISENKQAYPEELFSPPNKSEFLSENNSNSQYVFSSSSMAPKNSSSFSLKFLYLMRTFNFQNNVSLSIGTFPLPATPTSIGLQYSLQLEKKLHAHIQQTAVIWLIRPELTHHITQVGITYGTPDYNISLKTGFVLPLYLETSSFRSSNSASKMVPTTISGMVRISEDFLFVTENIFIHDIETSLPYSLGINASTIRLLRKKRNAYWDLGLCSFHTIDGIAYTYPSASLDYVSDYERTGRYDELIFSEPTFLPWIGYTKYFTRTKR